MYTKLFGSIVHSTIWREPDEVRLVWITMLALSDKHGCVWASVPGLADAARVSVEQCRQAIERLSSPDPDSRTQVAEGRRIEAIDGGWWLINHAKFQAIKNLDERRDQIRTAVQRHRNKQKQADDVINVINSNPLKSDVIAVSPSTQLNSAQTNTTTTSGREKPAPSSDEQAVATHYLAKHPKRRIGAKDTKAIRRALQAGYTVANLCLAIDGNASDEWHMVKKKHELDYILREGKVDTFIELGIPVQMVNPETGLLTPEGYARMRIS